jgi:hypothetical protein
MARLTFGGTTADWIWRIKRAARKELYGPLVVPPSITMWTAATGGTQITDLQYAGAPANSIPVGGDGSIPEFLGPDTNPETRQMWADKGWGPRVLLLTSRALAGPSGGPIPAGGSTGMYPTPDGAGGYAWKQGPAVFNVKDYGTFDPAATAATNAAALQAAQNAAAAAGGGRVVAPPGVYDCEGVIQDSHVWFDLAGVTLRHPTGDGAHIISARTRTTTGSIAAGSDGLTVANATGIEIGTLVGVSGAAGAHPLQSTTLSAAVDAVQTTGLVLTSTTGFPTTGYLVSEGEIIGYTGISATSELTGVTRGVYGTTTATHAAGAVIAYTWAMLSEVLAVGATITLADTATLAVTNAPVLIGTVRPRVTGVHFDGNRPAGGPPGGTTLPVNAAMVRWGVYDYTAERCGSALYLDRGTRDTEYNIIAHDCSVPESDRGSVAVFFRRASRNKGRVTITGGVWLGVLVDNRTTLATEWDGACDENEGLVHIRAVKYTPWKTNLGMTITGSNRNIFQIICSGVRTGLTLVRDEQVYTYDGSLPTTRGNVVTFLGRDIYQPWLLYAPGNVVSGFYEVAEANGSNEGNNLLLGAPRSSGGVPAVQHIDGTSTAPGMTFAAESNTGFYRIAAGQVQFVSQGALGVRLMPTGLLMRDATAIALIDPGTTNGTRIGGGATAKLGFWGATPVVRPSLTYSRTGETTAEAQLRAALVAAGLVTDSTTA